MRRWTTIAAGIGLAVACASSAAMPARDIPENLWLSAAISVDASGHITALDWDTLPPLQAMIAQGLTDKVRAWEFVPATLNGQPTWTRTGLTVRVHTQQDAAQNLSVQGDRVITGAMAGYGTVPPEYPLDAMREGASARIETEVTIAADGKIDIKRMDYEGNNQFYRKRFLSAAKQAMQRWTYHPEVVAGHAVPTPISIPITFCIEPSTFCEGLSRRDAARKQAATTREADLPPGLHVAKDSAIALKTPLADSGA